MPAQDKHPSHIRNVGQINSLAYKLTKNNKSRTSQLINLWTHQLTNPKNHLLVISSSHQLIKLTNSPLLPTHHSCQPVNSLIRQLSNSTT